MAAGKVSNLQGIGGVFGMWGWFDAAIVSPAAQGSAL